MGAFVCGGGDANYLVEDHAHSQLNEIFFDWMDGLMCVVELEWMNSHHNHRIDWSGVVNVDDPEEEEEEEELCTRNSVSCSAPGNQLKLHYWTKVEMEMDIHWLVEWLLSGWLVGLSWLRCMLPSLNQLSRALVPPFPFCGF